MRWIYKVIRIDVCVFFFNDTATTEIYTYLHTLSLHDALPIYERDEGEGEKFADRRGKHGADSGDHEAGILSGRARVSAIARCFRREAERYQGWKGFRAQCDTPCLRRLRAARGREQGSNRWGGGKMTRAKYGGGDGKRTGSEGARTEAPENFGAGA